MGDYFKRWRRKMGCLTLTMACGFTVLWLRSLSSMDTIGYGWTSSNGAIIRTKSYYTFLVDFRNANGTYDETDEKELSEPMLLDDLIAYQRSKTPIWDKKGMYSHEIRNHSEKALLRIPYWSIVLPLTAVSAFLLLSKPRQSNRMNIADPVHDETGGATS